MIRLHCLCLALVFSITSYSQVYFPPLIGDSWQTIDPSSLGWCQDSINKMYQWLEETDSKAFIVLKDGKIVLQKYFGTFTADSLHVWNSSGKTLTAFLVGIAQKKGYLSIDDKTSHYLGNGWSSLTTSQENMITIKTQLSMTTGLDDGVPDIFCTLPNCLVYKASPGTRWAYHNAPYTLLDSVLQIATGQTVNGFMNQYVKLLTGISGVFIKNGYNHIFVSNAKSMARFGLLLSQNGVWNGNPILQDSSYFQDMITSSQTLNKSYGYLTWLNSGNSFMIPQSQVVFPGRLCPNAPADMYAAEGKNAQIINVVPSSGIVLVRMGKSMGNSLVGTLYNDTIWQYMNHLSCSLKIKDLSANMNYKISPNPFQSNFSIQSLIGDEEIKIYNSLGQTINFNRSGNLFSFNKLERGLYFLKITRGDRTVSYQLLHL